MTLPGPDAGSTHDEIARRLQALQEHVESLAARPRVTLAVEEPPSFAGRRITVGARVTDAAGARPRVGARVTLVTTWGGLRPADRPDAPPQASLVQVSGIDGTCRCHLVAPGADELLPAQDAVLQGALRTLDAAARTPNELARAFRRLAVQYRWEANEQLRSAIDVYFRRFRNAIVDEVNPADQMQHWSSVTATVLAFVEEEAAASPAARPVAEDSRAAPPSGAVGSSALLTVSLKDWVGPWFQAYLALVEEDRGLDAELQQATIAHRDSGELLTVVYQRVNDFMAGQRGVAGDFAGRRASEAALRRFAGAGLADLPVETRLSVVPSLLNVSRVVAQGGARIAAALGETHASVGQEVRTAVGRLDITGRFLAVEQELRNKLNITELDRALNASETFVTVKSALNEKADQSTVASKADTAAVDEVRLLVADKAEATALAALVKKVDEKIGPGDFETFQARLLDVVGRKADAGAVESLAARVEAVAAEGMTETLRAQLKEMLDAKADAVTVDVLAEVLKDKVSSVSFTHFRIAMNEQLAAKAPLSTVEELGKAVGSKVDAANFESFRSELGETLQRKADAGVVTRLQDDLGATFRNRAELPIGALERDMTAARRAIARLNLKVFGE